MLKQKQTC